MIAMLIMTYIIVIVAILYKVDRICYKSEQKRMGERRLYRRYVKAQDRRQSC